MGYSFPLNSAPARALADDKAAACELFETDVIPAIPHRLFLRPGLGAYVGADGNWAAIRAFAEAHGCDLVVKPNEGTGGMGVVRAQTWRELEAAVHNGFETHRSLALSPFVEIGAEHRVILLDEEVLLAYSKQRPQVVGDGDSTLGALALRAGLRLLPGSDPDEILPSGEARLLDWRHNLGRGSRPASLPDPTAVADLARRAARSLGLRFASIDIAEVDGRHLVLEANAGVMLETYARVTEDGLAVAERIYGAALDRMFLA